MAECTIRMVSNPRTGKRDIYIDFDSERDALPHEHEKDHRARVKSLLGPDIFDEHDVGQIVVSRGEPGAVESERRQEAASRDAAAEGQSSS